MIHIADTKVERRYGDFFIRQIHKFEEVRLTGPSFPTSMLINSCYELPSPLPSPPPLSTLVVTSQYACFVTKMTLVTEHPELRKEGNNYFLQYCLVK